MDGVAPRGVGATRVVLVGAFVCSVAPYRRLYILIYILIRFVNPRLAHPHIASAELRGRCGKQQRGVG